MGNFLNNIWEGDFKITGNLIVDGSFSGATGTSFTGGTVAGATTFTGGLSASTLSGDGSGLINIPGSATTITLQDAYNNGNQITFNTGYPLTISSTTTSPIVFKIQDLSGTSRAQFYGNGQMDATSIRLYGNATLAPNVSLYQSPDVAYTPSDPSNGTTGGLNFLGWDGVSAYGNATAVIRAVAEETYSPTNKGTSLYFRTTSTGNTSSTVRMLIHSNGNIGVGSFTTKPSAKLHVNNTTTENSFLVEDSTSPDSTPFVIDNAGNVGIGTLTATEKLEVNGNAKIKGISFGYVEKSSNYTITSNDYIVNCTGGTFNITLPTAVGITGKKFTITNSGTGRITLLTTSSQTIQGDLTQKIYKDETFDVMSTGSNWIVI